MKVSSCPLSLGARLPLVLAAMQATIDAQSCAEPYRELSTRLVSGVARQAGSAVERSGWMPFINLPFDITEATGGEPALAVALSAACAFVFSGLDVIDDIADGDCQPQWEGVPAAQQTLVGISAMVSYSQLLILNMPLPQPTLLAMLSRLAQRMLQAGVGQQLDLSLVGAEQPDPEVVVASVSGKTGEQLALYCEWAALAAGSSTDIVAAWGDYGRSLGIAAQLKSDMSELCHDEWCRDLASGNRTLPIAYQLQKKGAAHSGFVELLAQARTDLRAQHEVRRLLIESGAMRKSALVAQLYVERGRGALQRTGVREPWLSRLVALLDGLDTRTVNPISPNPLPQLVATTGLFTANFGEASFNR